MKLERRGRSCIENISDFSHDIWTDPTKELTSFWSKTFFQTLISTLGLFSSFEALQKLFSILTFDNWHNQR